MQEYIAGNTEIPAIRDEITEVAGFLWQRGWAERNAGNLSYNVTRAMEQMPPGFDFGEAQKLDDSYPGIAGQMILLTGTGTRMRDVWKDLYTNTCIIEISKEGNAYRQMKKPELDHYVVPTSELPSHLAIHEMLVKNRRREKVVIHTHPDHLIALTHIRDFCDEERINNMLWSIQPETRVFIDDGIGFIPYLMTGTSAIADATIKALEKHRVILWEKHGCLAIGETAHEAFDLIDIAEKSARIFFTCKSSGFEAEGIAKNDLDDLKKNFSLRG